MEKRVKRVGSAQSSTGTCVTCVCVCVCEGPSLPVGNTPTGFMSEGNEQAPVPSGWWYDLSFCTSLLSAAALSHMPFQPGSEGDFLPPPPPLSTQNTFHLPLTLLLTLERACGHLSSGLMLSLCLFHAGEPVFAFSCSRVSPYIRFGNFVSNICCFFLSHSKSHSAQTDLLTIHS